MVSWFYSSNAYVEDGSMDVYNTGIYNPYRIQAIKEWNQNGLASFCPSVDVKNDLGDIFFNDIGIGVSLNLESWKQTEDIEEFSEEEITNAMLLILYGKNGVELQNGECFSSLNSITEIEPRLFSTCVTEINRIIAPNAASDALQDLWNDKRKSYYGEEIQNEE